MIFDKFDKLPVKDKRQVFGVFMMFGFVYGAMIFYGQLLILLNSGVIRFAGSLFLNMGNFLLIFVCYYLLTWVYKYNAKT